MRTYDSNFFKAKNINTNWVQENHSLNLSKNTIRGLHFIRNPHTDGKLIRCIKGRVYDVFVDLKKTHLPLEVGPRHPRRKNINYYISLKEWLMAFVH